MSVKIAAPDHPVHELIANRWSPYAFDATSVSDAELAPLFEAARWSASSYNEQPWRFIVASRDDREGFDAVLSCLVEGNQAWAGAAGALALGVASMRFSRNDKLNKAAHHDLGLATAGLSFEATARGLAVHPMIGIVADRARMLYRIPDGFEPLIGVAIGRAAAAEDAPEAFRTRDETPRTRKRLAEFVFSGTWGHAARLA